MDGDLQKRERSPRCRAAFNRNFNPLREIRAEARTFQTTVRVEKLHLAEFVAKPEFLGARLKIKPAFVHLLLQHVAVEGQILQDGIVDDFGPGHIKMAILQSERPSGNSQ